MRTQVQSNDDSGPGRFAFLLYLPPWACRTGRVNRKIDSTRCCGVGTDKELELKLGTQSAQRRWLLGVDWIKGKSVCHMTTLTVSEPAATAAAVDTDGFHGCVALARLTIFFSVLRQVGIGCAADYARWGLVSKASAQLRICWFHGCLWHRQSYSIQSCAASTSTCTMILQFVTFDKIPVQ